MFDFSQVDWASNFEISIDFSTQFWKRSEDRRKGVLLFTNLILIQIKTEIDLQSKNTLSQLNAAIENRENYFSGRRYKKVMFHFVSLKTLLKTWKKYCKFTTEHSSLLQSRNNWSQLWVVVYITSSSSCKMPFIYNSTLWGLTFWIGRSLIIINWLSEKEE